MLDRRRHASLVITLAAVALAGACEYVALNGDVAQPFEGPGFSLADGLTAPVPDSGEFVVAATRLVVADGDEPIQLFDDHMAELRVVLADGPPGLVGYSVRQNLFSRGGYRTVSVWESPDAMWAFVLGDAHFAAIEDADRIGAAGTKVVQFTIPADALPPRWDSIIDKTDNEGRETY